MTAHPGRVRLRAYKVGFGDCLLLTVTYGSRLPDGTRERHMLIDCGTVENADGGPSVATIATHVAEHCNGRLDVVVATHRHRDHIGGFGNRRARKVLDKLDPRVVVRPWTDIPEEQRDDPGFGLDESHRRFIGILDSLPPQAEALARLAFDNDRVAKRAARLAELGFKNTEAVALLEEWGRRGRAEYVKAGALLDLAEPMPGVTVRVLGPPTLDQVPALTRYAKESEEYWLALAGEGALTPLLEQGGEATLDRARRRLADPGGTGAAEWLLRTLNERRISQGLEIVEALDDVLNNTSLILLVTVGSRRLLLPGDAQAENWSLTLDQAQGINGRPRDARLAAALAKVDLYKVGHHGSRNATPRRLTQHWANRVGADHPVVSVLTTKKGVYEKSTEGKVPTDELVTELERCGPVYNTDDLDPDVWWMDLEAPARGRAAFTYTPGPAVGSPD
jgi:hypothetical protein